MQLLGVEKERLSLGDFLKLETFCPLFFSPFRTVMPSCIKRCAIFATEKDFNNIIDLLISTLMALKTASRNTQF